MHPRHWVALWNGILMRIKRQNEMPNYTLASNTMTNKLPKFGVHHLLTAGRQARGHNFATCAHLNAEIRFVYAISRCFCHSFHLEDGDRIERQFCASYFPLHVAFVLCDKPARQWPLRRRNLNSRKAWRCHLLDANATIVFWWNGSIVICRTLFSL